MLTLSWEDHGDHTDQELRRSERSCWPIELRISSYWPRAEKIMAMDVQRVLFLILGRKGRTRMKKIWLISLPEKIQAASWLRIPNCFSGLKRDVNKNYHKSQRYTVHYTVYDWNRIICTVNSPLFFLLRWSRKGFLKMTLHGIFLIFDSK